jgi:ribosomal protein S18 acetylase RimI-like enzyme
VRCGQIRASLGERARRAGVGHLGSTAEAGPDGVLSCGGPVPRSRATPILADERQLPTADRAPLLELLRGTIVAGVAAAALGYGLHHVEPLRAHPVLGVLAAVLVAGGLGSLLAAAVARARRLGPPVVVLAGARDLRLEPLSRTRLGFTAALHASSLPGGFFADLGEGFLRRYHATFVDSPHAVGLLACVEGHPVGFLLGMIRAPAHARWVLRHRGPALALSAATALAVRPRVALRFVRTRLRRYMAAWRRHRGAGAGAAPAAPGDVAVLGHIAVLRGVRGTGAGSRLVRAFEDEARREGATRAVLTTLEGAEGAGPFYERLGWRQGTVRTTPDGTRMEEWTRDLAAEATA